MLNEKLCNGCGGGGQTFIKQYIGENCAARPARGVGDQGVGGKHLLYYSLGRTVEEGDRGSGWANINCTIHCGE